MSVLEPDFERMAAEVTLAQTLPDPFRESKRKLSRSQRGGVR